MDLVTKSLEEMTIEDGNVSLEYINTRCKWIESDRTDAKIARELAKEQYQSKRTYLFVRSCGHADNIINHVLETRKEEEEISKGNFDRRWRSSVVTTKQTRIKWIEPFRPCVFRGLPSGDFIFMDEFSLPKKRAQNSMTVPVDTDTEQKKMQWRKYAYQKEQREKEWEEVITREVFLTHLILQVPIFIAYDTLKNLVMITAENLLEYFPEYFLLIQKYEAAKNLPQRSEGEIIPMEVHPIHSFEKY